MCSFIFYHCQANSKCANTICNQAHGLLTLEGKAFSRSSRLTLRKEKTYQCIEWLCWLHSNQQWCTWSSRHIGRAQIYTRTHPLRSLNEMQMIYRHRGWRSRRAAITSRPNHHPLSIQISAQDPVVINHVVQTPKLKCNHHAVTQSGAANGHAARTPPSLE